MRCRVERTHPTAENIGPEWGRNLPARFVFAAATANACHFRLPGMSYGLSRIAGEEPLTSPPLQFLSRLPSARQRIVGMTYSAPGRMPVGHPPVRALRRAHRRTPP